MEKLKDETLVQILKDGKAYGHELRLMIPELQFLREVHDGKRKMPEEDFLVLAVPRTYIEDDEYVSFSDATLMLNEPGGYKLAKSASWVGRRFIVHRIR